MRILHIIAGAPVGGAETFAVDAITGLASRGMVQHVICRPYAEPLRRYAEAGVATTTMRFAAIGNVLGGRRRVGELAQSFGADLLHAWMSRAGSFVPARLPIPAVGWFGDYYKLKYFAACDSFFAVTPDITASIVKRGMPKGRVFTTNTFGTMPDAAPVDRASLNTPNDAIVALVLSRMHQVKGIDTILHAAAAVPGLYLWLAGDGPGRAEYAALAQRLGLADRVRFLGWRTDRKALLDACDICALPSRYEPFGTVIIEAWAAGRPLVATTADGARQYVRDGIDGLLCPPDDPAALAACLERVAHDNALAARLAQAGGARYQADFTREIVLDRLIDAYRQVLVLGKRPASR